MDATILIVEDDDSIRELTAMGLGRAGFRTITAVDGDDGLRRFEEHRPDAVVLDLMLPGTEGLEVCRRLRAHSGVPIVMLTARSDTIDLVVGLECGADDYVTKPFEMPELVARLRAALRRVQPSEAPEVLRLGPVRIDASAHRVEREEADGSVTPVELTRTEFRLLTELARRPNQVFTRELLLERVWGYDHLGDSRLVDVAVQRLRAKIEPDPQHPTLVMTVRGVGYRAS